MIPNFFTRPEPPLWIEGGNTEKRHFGNEKIDFLPDYGVKMVIFSEFWPFRSFFEPEYPY